MPPVRWADDQSGGPGESARCRDRRVVEVASTILGLFVLAIATGSVLRTIVVPRGLSSGVSRVIIFVVVGGIRLVSNRLRSYRQRDHLLAFAGPVAILSLLVAWLLLFWFGYAMLMFPGERSGLDQAFRESGSSLFTLGYASGSGAPLTFLDFCAAATGPIVIGLMIGFLPTLYSSFSRREVDVTQLGWIAGEPNWGPELLARQWSLSRFDDLPEMLRTWTVWAAVVSESHTTNPILIIFRSTKSLRNWAVALVAVMDAAALQIALLPSMPQGRARSMLSQGERCLASITATFGAQDRPKADDPDVVTRADFDRAFQRLKAAEVPMQAPQDAAWTTFRELRSRYEAEAASLCRTIDAVPSWWTGSRTPPTEPIATPILADEDLAPPPHRRDQRSRNDQDDSGEDPIG